MARHSVCSPARHIYPGRDLSCEGQRVDHSDGCAGTQTGYRKDHCRCCDCKEWKRRDNSKRPGTAPRASLPVAQPAPASKPRPETPRPAQPRSGPRPAPQPKAPAGLPWELAESKHPDVRTELMSVLADLYRDRGQFYTFRWDQAEGEAKSAYRGRLKEIWRLTGVFMKDHPDAGFTRGPDDGPGHMSGMQYTRLLMGFSVPDDDDDHQAPASGQEAPQAVPQPRTARPVATVDGMSQAMRDQLSQDRAIARDKARQLQAARNQEAAIEISAQARHERDCANGVHTQEITDQVTGRVFCRWCSVTLRESRHLRDCENNVHTKQITDPVTGRVYCGWCQETLTHGYPPERPIMWPSYDPGTY
jgi:hypothetical protein